MSGDNDVQNMTPEQLRPMVERAIGRAAKHHFEENLKWIADGHIETMRAKLGPDVSEDALATAREAWVNTSVMQTMKDLPLTEIARKNITDKQLQDWIGELAAQNAPEPLEDRIYTLMDAKMQGGAHLIDMEKSRIFHEAVETSRSVETFSPYVQSAISAQKVQVRLEEDPERVKSSESQYGKIILFTDLLDRAGREHLSPAWPGVSPRGLAEMAYRFAHEYAHYPEGQLNPYERAARSNDPEMALSYLNQIVKHPEFERFQKTDLQYKGASEKPKITVSREVARQEADDTLTEDMMAKILAQRGIAKKIQEERAAKSAKTIALTAMGIEEGPVPEGPVADAPQPRKKSPLDLLEEMSTPSSEKSGFAALVTPPKGPKKDSTPPSR